MLQNLDLTCLWNLVLLICAYESVFVLEMWNDHISLYLLKLIEGALQDLRRRGRITELLQTLLRSIRGIDKCLKQIFQSDVEVVAVTWMSVQPSLQIGVIGLRIPSKLISTGIILQSLRFWELYHGPHVEKNPHPSATYGFNPKLSRVKFASSYDRHTAFYLGAFPK